LDSQLSSQLRSQLSSQLDSQLDSQLYSQLYSQLSSQLYSQLYSQLSSQLDSQKKSWHGGRHRNYLYAIDVWGKAYFKYWEFLVKELKIDAKINPDLEMYSSLNEASGIFNLIMSELVCVISKYPKKIYRDADNRLHNPVGPAIEWEYISEQTNFENYYIHGRNLPKWIWEKSAKGTVTREDFLTESNEEIKAGLYEVMGQQKVMNLLAATVIDKKIIKHANGENEIVKLLKTKDTFKEIDNQPFAWVSVVCPSTGSNYLLGVEPHHTNAKKALASLSMFEENEYSFNYRT
jgi:hypothetical protein